MTSQNFLFNRLWLLVLTSFLCFGCSKSNQNKFAKGSFRMGALFQSLSPGGGLKSASADANNKCLDIVAQSTAEASTLHLWDCGDWDSQNFVLQGDGTIRAYGGANAADAGGPLCLDIYGANAADDTAISLYKCHGGQSQQWVYDIATQHLHGTGSLSNFCLDYDTRNTGGQVINGTHLHLWTCYSDVQSQKWSFGGGSSTSPTQNSTSSNTTSNTSSSTATSASGLKSISVESVNKCLDIAGQSTAEGSTLHLWDCGGWASQNFVLQSDGTIRAYGGANAADAGGPLCLDIYAARAADDTPIYLYKCHGGQSQQWVYDSGTQQLHGTGSLSNFCLDYDTRTTGGQVVNGTHLHLWTCYSTAQSQKWAFGFNTATNTNTGSNTTTDTSSNTNTNTSSNIVYNGNLGMRVLPYKARYAPGETPGFTVTVYNSSSSSITGTIRLRQTSPVKPGFEHVDYRSTTIGASSSREEDMYWVGMPGDDFTGYFVEATFTPDGSSSAQAAATTAVDISSTWTRYPRYGYISEFFEGQSLQKSQSIIDTLSREFHISGMQYYDWQFRHDNPLPPDGSTTWLDWRGNEGWWGPNGPKVSMNVLNDMISRSHERGSAAMPYVAAYGAINGYDKYGVNWQWALYNSSGGQLSSSGGNTQFFMMNPLDNGWQNYIIPRFQYAVDRMNWDGVHIDTYGDLGNRNYYNYLGQRIDVNSVFFSPLVNRIKQSMSSKTVAFNVVDGGFGALGSDEMSNPGTGVDFFYTEFWATKSYGDASAYINGMRERSGKTVVVAGYMNRYNDVPEFDANSIRLADAAFFSSGAMHIELGNSIGSNNNPAMLANEYFPSASKSMSLSLRGIMKSYYDFATAYENLLFDPSLRRQARDTSGIWVQDLQDNLSGWGEGGRIWYQRYRHSQYDVLHFINLTNGNDQWRDVRGTPTTFYNKEVKYYVPGGVRINRCMLASPDLNGGAAQDLNCQTLSDSGGTYVRFVIPELSYWDMIYIDRQGQY